MLDLFLEGLPLVVFGMVGFLLAGVEDGFDFFDPPGHAHILIEYLKAFHEPELSIFEFFEGDGVGDIS